MIITFILSMPLFALKEARLWLEGPSRPSSNGARLELNFHRAFAGFSTKPRRGQNFS
jgi:hypothetical protein